MTVTFYPEPLAEPRTGREAAEAVVATDVAGMVEPAAWDDIYLTPEDRKALRVGRVS